jgi:hypothetical protein
LFDTFTDLPVTTTNGQSSPDDDVEFYDCTRRVKWFCGNCSTLNVIEDCSEELSYMCCNCQAWHLEQSRPFPPRRQAMLRASVLIRESAWCTAVIADNADDTYSLSDYGFGSPYRPDNKQKSITNILQRWNISPPPPKLSPTLSVLRSHSHKSLQCCH